MKQKKPKKFKHGKIELWANFTFNSFRYIASEKGDGEHIVFDDLKKSKWYKNSVPRKVLLLEKSDEFLGYL